MFSYNFAYIYKTAPVWSAPNLSTFRKSLKMHLFREAYPTAT